ncbi:hypothetical protein PTKIN_Ptkin02bG0207500 [Pterospermum kingtungense]
MALSAVSNVAARLGQLLTQEAQYLWGVEDQFNRLQRELVWMKSFLKEANSRQAEDERVRLWVSEIRDIAYDAEDVIDTFALKIASKGKGGCVSRVVKKSACMLKQGWTLHNIRSDIEQIIAKINDLTRRLQTYGIRDIREGEGSSSSSRRRELRQSFSHIVETNVVGFDDDIRQLASALVDEGRHFRVASICGMGGLGKTTLAKKVYRHSEVRNHFKYFVWVYVSQQCQRKKVWKGILSSLGLVDDKGGILGLEDEEDKLAERMYNFLKENKCLVVLDDIWRADDWEAIRPGFPMEEMSLSGTKLLLTTRNMDVALHIDPRGCLHELQCLTDEDSFKLFQSLAFPTSDSAEFVTEEELVELGKDMVNQCGGVPLAIVVLGGILATKYSLNDWQKVHKSVKSHLKRGGVWGIHETLALSYEDMPSHLKPCFLYLSVFPEDYEIPAVELIQLWVAEDLVSLEKGERDGEEMVEDVAEHYLNELAERYMVQVGLRDSSFKILTCRMHDLVRDLCLSKAKHESFLCIIDDFKMEETGASKLSPEIGKIRRLSIHKSVLVNSINIPHLRSLLYFDDIVPNDILLTCSVIQIVRPLILGENSFENLNLTGMLRALFALSVILCLIVHKTRRLSTYIFNNFKQLRVLNFHKESVLGCKLVSDIGCLIHLRFLNLGSCSLARLPSSISKLQCLITLNLSSSNGWYSQIHVPNVIWKMQQLRHLYLPRRCDKNTKLKLGNLINLQTLMNFNTKNCYLGDISGMKNLKELGFCTPFNVEGFREDLNLNPLITSKHLRSLYVDSDERTDRRHLTYLLTGCVNVYQLAIRAEINKLPNLEQISRSITHICLIGSKLDEDPMPILERLPKLIFLELKEDVLMGMVMICSATGFPRLESLSVYSHKNLEELRVSQGAMSNLRALAIADCRNLKMLPDELRSITALESLMIQEMPSAFKDKLVHGGEDYYKVQHVPSIIFQDCDD